MLYFQIEKTKQIYKTNIQNIKHNFGNISLL